MDEKTTKKNQNVQTFGWASLASLAAFAIALFAVSSHLLSPMKIQLGYATGQLESLSKIVQSHYDISQEECKTALAFRADTARRSSIIERDVSRLDSRISTLETLFHDFKVLKDKVTSLERDVKNDRR